jgi:hypothetical protein
VVEQAAAEELLAAELVVAQAEAELLAAETEESSLAAEEAQSAMQVEGKREDAALAELVGALFTEHDGNADGLLGPAELHGLVQALGLDMEEEEVAAVLASAGGAAAGPGRAEFENMLSSFEQVVG